MRYVTSLLVFLILVGCGNQPTAKINHKQAIEPASAEATCNQDVDAPEPKPFYLTTKKKSEGKLVIISRRKSANGFDEGKSISISIPEPEKGFNERYSELSVVVARSKHKILTFVSRSQDRWDFSKGSTYTDQFVVSLDSENEIEQLKRITNTFVNEAVAFQDGWLIGSKVFSSRFNLAIDSRSLHEPQWCGSLISCQSEVESSDEI